MYIIRIFVMTDLYLYRENVHAVCNLFERCNVPSGHSKIYRLLKTQPEDHLYDILKF